MEIFASIGLIVWCIWACNKDKWKADRRIPPPGKKTDWQAVGNDRILRGMSDIDIYRKMNRGGYDIPNKSKSNKEEWEDFKRRHPNGNWN